MGTIVEKWKSVPPSFVLGFGGLRIEETKQKLGTGLAGSLARPTQHSSQFLEQVAAAAGLSPLRSTPLNVLLVCIFDAIESFNSYKMAKFRFSSVVHN